MKYLIKIIFLNIIISFHFFQVPCFAHSHIPNSSQWEGDYQYTESMGKMLSGTSAFVEHYLRIIPGKSKNEYSGFIRSSGRMSNDTIYFHTISKENTLMVIYEKGGIFFGKDFKPYEFSPYKANQILMDISIKNKNLFANLDGYKMDNEKIKKITFKRINKIPTELLE